MPIWSVALADGSRPAPSGHSPFSRIPVALRPVACTVLESVTMQLDKETVYELETRLGYEFADRSLVRSALTHRSLAHERGDHDHYERLEFLGDAVLGLVTSEWLFLRFPESPEGGLARLKSYLVSAPVLAQYAQTIGLGDLLLLGLGEERSGGRHKPSLLADTLEAIFGAVYLDRGLEAAASVIHNVLEAALDQDAQLASQDAKTQLQELLQARGSNLPNYKLVEESGPDHSKRFRVECWVMGELAGEGGRNEQEECRANGRERGAGEYGFKIFDPLRNWRRLVRLPIRAA